MGFMYFLLLGTILIPAVRCVSVRVVRPPYTYDTRYCEQKLDHFNFLNTETFPLRYLISKEFWNPHEGTIFFYPGNEGKIEDFAQNTGLMWELASQFGAMIVFAEHRYYGASLPRGNTSDEEYYGYLSTVQVLADFADLLVNLKQAEEGAADVPVIAFGGSYGGMLAAWMRLKYPNIIEAALASSAPFMLGEDVCESFQRLSTADFRYESPECSKAIRRSWDIINNLNTAEGRSNLTETFHLCKPLNSTNDITKFKSFLANVYGTVAMINYPQANSFIRPVPAWPVKEMCRYLTDSTVDDHALLEDLYLALSVYMNFTGSTKCIDLDDVYGDSIGASAWDYQCCTELVLPECSDGIQDMYESSPWNLTNYIDDCNQTFGVIPDVTFVDTMYGGILQSSNIIFSNGDLDPWSGGGIMESLSDSLIAIHIADAAHHLDLRPSEESDPQSVINARNSEKLLLKKWIKNYWLRLRQDATI